MQNETKQVSAARMDNAIADKSPSRHHLTGQQRSASRRERPDRCCASQASARQVRISGDRRTNKQAGHRHRLKFPLGGRAEPPAAGRGLKN